MNDLGLPFCELSSSEVRSVVYSRLGDAFGDRSQDIERRMS